MSSKNITMHLEIKNYARASLNFLSRAGAPQRAMSAPSYSQSSGQETLSPVGQHERAEESGQGRELPPSHDEIRTEHHYHQRI